MPHWEKPVPEHDSFATMEIDDSQRRLSDGGLQRHVAARWRLLRGCSRLVDEILPMMNPYPLLSRLPRSAWLALALGLYFLLLFLGGQQTAVDHLPGRLDYSKVYHLVFYSMWSAMIWLAMRSPTVLAATLFTMLAGAGDELHQYFLPFRGARISDVAIDTAAALAGALLMTRMRLAAMRTVQA
jgi:VanZ family protein